MDREAEVVGMARFRKIDVRVHGDDKFRALSPSQPCGRYLWLHLLTSPSTTNIPGLYGTGEAALAEEIGWPLEGFREAFREVSSRGMAHADWKARLVWVPRAINYNEPESPNVVRSWRVAWDELPECALKREAFSALESFVEAKGEAFQKAFREACGHPSRKALANQEQEQEQEQEKEEPPVVPLSGGPIAPSLLSLENARQRKTRSRSWPADFRMTAEHRAFAVDGGINDPALEWGHFRDHHQAKGSLFADWNAAWRTWCRNTVKFAAVRR